VAEAEVDSLVRSSFLIMKTVTTITSTVDPTSVNKKKLVGPSLFGSGSSSAGGTDPTTGVFSDLTSSDFLVGVIRTVINPDTDLENLITEFNVGTARQICLSAEVRMCVEYNVKEKRRLKSIIEMQDELLKDETNALRERKAILEKKRNALDVKVIELETSATGKEHELTELNALITSVKWLLTQGMELAIIKCLNSLEYFSALEAAIGKAIEKGTKGTSNTAAATADATMALSTTF
nr:hypothetical protein [Tanacetum cinerariifolium]